MPDTRGDRPISDLMPFIQDCYPDDYAHCHGCGRLNAHGLHVQSEWVDGEAIASFTPAPHHLSMPGFVYGGLIACLIDCHSMAAAAGATMVAAGSRPGIDETPRFVTASLTVDYRKPTPMGVPLILRARAVELRERKAVVQVHVLAGDVECVTARVIAVRIPDAMVRPA